MKFADFQGQRHEAKPGMAATCPSCGSGVIAKCGEHRVWHWAHRGARTCDQWWESETKWHRDWKNEFPTSWQEIIHFAQSGEKHVADVKTEGGTVLEFQHSYLKAEERVARESFYGKMIWVVDGRRRRRDAAQFLKCIGPCVWGNSPIILYGTNHEECALLRDWNDSPVPVYFDLGIETQESGPTFWRRDPVSRNGRVYLSPITRESFLKAHREILDAEDSFSQCVQMIVENLKQAAQRSRSTPLAGFQRYLSNRRGGRRL